MRKLLLAAFFLLSSLGLHAQTTTVTGNLKTVLGENLGTNTFVRFRLRNYKPNRPLVSGVGIIGQTTKDVPPDSNGLISTTVYDNDFITPDGTFYTLEFYLQSRFVFAASYEITGASFDFNTATPLSSVPMAAVPVAESRVFTHIQATPATTWTIIHNFAVREVTLDFYDANFNRIFPDLVTLTDINTVTALFVVAQSGRAVVMRAENVNLTSSISDPVLKVPTTSQSISGGFDLTLDGNFLLATTGQNIGSATVRPDIFMELGTFYNTFAPNVTGVAIGTASARPDGTFDVFTSGIFDSIRVVNGTRFACSSAGINAADTDLGSSLGEIWVTSACDGSSFTTAVTLTSAHTLRFSSGIFDFQAAITSQMGTWVEGVANAGTNVGVGTELEHNFNGDFLIWDGSGTASRGGGGGIRNIRVTNTYTGGDLNGNIVVVKGTTASQRAGGWSIENFSFSGLSDSFRATRCILIDGSAIGGTDAILDINLLRVKCSGSGTDFQDIRIDTAGNVFGFNVRVSNFKNGAQTNGMTVTGTATAPASEIHFAASALNTLALDRVGNMSWFGGSINTTTNTANCTGNIVVFLATLSSAPTNNCGDNFGVIRLTGGDFTFTQNLNLLQTAAEINGAGSITINSQDATNGVAINRLGIANAPFSVKESGTNNNNLIVSGSLLGKTQVQRLFADLGTDLVAGDIAISTTGAWGDTSDATVGSVTGNDQWFQWTITAGGANTGANPTIVITFTDGTWTNAPIVLCNRQDFNAPATVTITVTTVATGSITLTFDGTPTATNTYKFACHVGGI